MDKDDTIAIIRSLLSSSATSFTVSRLNKEFKNETGMDIPHFGYNSISNFLHSIPNVVKLTGIYPIQKALLVTNEKSGHIASLVKRQKKGKQQKSFTIRKKQNKRNSRFTRHQEWQNCVEKGTSSGFKNEKFYDQILKSSRLACSNNWLCICEKVSPIDLKLHASVGEYTEVYPCEIIDPHKFYFHFRKMRKKLKHFMDDLQMFYGTHEEIPKISASLIRPKQICAVFEKINGKTLWCRAEIVNILNDVLVTVNLMDFGFSKEISKEKLKFLHKRFISFPKQACAGFLANIKPLSKSQEWSCSAIRRFCDLAFEKDLVAGVVCIDVENCALGMALSFTKGPEIHVNDALVTEGHALFQINHTDSEVEDITFCGFNEFYDKRKHYSEEFSTCTSNRSLLQNNFPAGLRKSVRTPIFYGANIRSSNYRLRKIFSGTKGAPGAEGQA